MKKHRMTIIVIAVAIVVAIIVIVNPFSSKQVAPLPDGWGDNWAEASRLSRERSKPILADFTGSDWCRYCVKLHNEVFVKPEFVEWAKKNVILLELDFPKMKKQSDELKEQNEALSKKYAIAGFPTILLLDHTGKVIGKTGYAKGGPGKFIEEVEKIIKKEK